jgi:hypothetical protein
VVAVRFRKRLAFSKQANDIVYLIDALPRFIASL